MSLFTKRSASLVGCCALSASRPAASFGFGTSMPGLDDLVVGSASRGASSRMMPPRAETAALASSRHIPKASFFIVKNDSDVCEDLTFINWQQTIIERERK